MLQVQIFQTDSLLQPKQSNEFKFQNTDFHTRLTILLVLPITLPYPEHPDRGIRGWAEGVSVNVSTVPVALLPCTLKSKPWLLWRRTRLTKQSRFFLHRPTDVL